MASRDGFRVDGLSQVVTALTRLGLAVEDPADAMRDIAGEAARLVAGNAPRRTGELAASAASETSKGRAAAVLTAPYAGVINYGWPAHNITAAGFIQRSDPALASFALRRIEAEINTYR